MFREADAYDRHIGRYSGRLARALIKAAGVRSGQRALDVGCGPGGLTAELAAVLGPAHVAAVDPSAPFAEACRRRVPGARVAVAAAEELPFADRAFDHALAQLVVNFMSDAEAGVCEMARVAGRVSAAVWDYKGEMTLLRAFWDSAAALDGDARDRDEGRSMRYCTPEELEQLWSACGLDEVRVSPAVVTAAYDGFEDLWDPLARGVGPAGAYAAALEPDARDELHDELRRRLGVADAPFELSARAWIVTGSLASRHRA